MGNKQPFKQLFMTTFSITVRKHDEIVKEVAKTAADVEPELE